MTYEILSAAEMAEADRLTIEGGVPGYDLMARAGRAVADIVSRFYAGRPVLVLCGPGNNGGDGFVAARFLAERSFEVRVACLVKPSALKGDAARAASDWPGATLPFSGLDVRPEELVVDAVFGTGFSRRLESPVTDVFGKVRDAGCAVLAVDIPSGVNGSTGEGDEAAPAASQTVTFCRKKIGHVLLPGQALCGHIHVADIGIPDEAVAKAGHSALENHPALWRISLKGKKPGSHKYDYGHAVLYGGPRMTGAACMAAHAAMRVGAGLCTIAADPVAADIYRGDKPNFIYEPLASLADFADHLKDSRRNAVLIGPGAGRGDPYGLKNAVQAALRSGHHPKIVLDADALTVFEDRPELLYKALKASGQAVLTPHEGEFCLIFPSITGTKIDKARAAAAKTAAVVVLKGGDTVVAAPGGRCVVNTSSSPWLATAGTGDVLAGMILGLLAQGTPPFEASCAAVWMHGEAARRFGAGLTAPDIPDLLPAILGSLAELP